MTPQQHRMGMMDLAGLRPMHTAAHFIEHSPQTPTSRLIPNPCRFVLLCICVCLLAQSLRPTTGGIALDNSAVEGQFSMVRENSGKIPGTLGGGAEQEVDIAGDTSVTLPLEPVAPTHVPTPAPTEHHYFVVLQEPKLTCETMDCGTGSCKQDSPGGDDAPECVCHDGTVQTTACGDTPIDAPTKACLPGSGLLNQLACKTCPEDMVSPGGVGAICQPCPAGTFPNPQHSECEAIDVGALAVYELHGAKGWWWWAVVIVILVFLAVAIVAFGRDRRNKYNGEGKFSTLEEENYAAEEVEITEPNIFIARDDEIRSSQILGADSASDNESQTGVDFFDY